MTQRVALVCRAEGRIAIPADDDGTSCRNRVGHAQLDAKMTVFPSIHPPGALTVPPAPAVAADCVWRRFGEGDSAVEAVRGVSLRLMTGEFTAVMGPSGSGKSTLMHMLAGLDRPSDGSVEIGGVDITRMDDRSLTLLRRRCVGFIFQSFNLLPMLTAEENILLPLSVSGRKPDREWTEAIIARVGLADRRRHRPSQLSGGQQQRVAVARALVTEPTLLLADEPTGNLDSHTGGEVLALLREAASEYGQATLMVTHDARAAAAADRVLFLADGRIVRDLAAPTEDEVLQAMRGLR